MSAESASALARAVSRKAAAELADVLPRSRVSPSGSAPADVLVLKGDADPLDIEKGSALAGEDGEALCKALDALGWGGPPYALCLRDADPALSAESLALVVEAVDPDLVIALDGHAASDIAAALGVTLIAGEPAHVRGRLVLAIDDFVASLGDEVKKRRVWSQLKSVRRD